ncbi:MAG: hypothetical protein J6X86_07475 [Bacteroidales bacterium]|nr:hypothetical protein [Bacteroidales bacterium]
MKKILCIVVMASVCVMMSCNGKLGNNKEKEKTPEEMKMISELKENHKALIDNYKNAIDSAEHYYNRAKYSKQLSVQNYNVQKGMTFLEPTNIEDSFSRRNSEIEKYFKDDKEVTELCAKQNAEQDSLRKRRTELYTQLEKEHDILEKLILNEEKLQLIESNKKQ